MISKFLATALLTTALMTSAASAQTATNKRDSTTNVDHKEGEWRASKLSGVNVYNGANEKIGDIQEVILDKSGKVAHVILAVGGFLGMGEHYVAVPFDKLTWVDQPVTSTTASTTAPANAPATSTAADGTTRTTGAATTTTTTTITRNANENWYPDHAVYNASKDELKAMPEFKY
jgi:sporulation protein YlmC with PRC-barrel domain